MKISLDSTIFRDLDFVDWLYINKDNFKISISVIVALETSYWYKLRGLEKSMFPNEIKKINGTIIDLVADDIDLISQYSINSKLRFKHHARDLIIGSHSLKINSILITANTKHFQWMSDNVMTPDDFVIMVTDKN